MTRTMRLFVVAVLIPLLLPAQTVPSIGETLEISIVNVDVFVTDRKGNRVRGLKASDFEIYENGVKQTITNFAEYTGAAETTGVTVDGTPRPAEPAPQTPKRTVIVFFEHMQLQPFHAKPFFEEMKKLARQTIREGDTLSLVVWNRHGASVQYDVGDEIDMFEQAVDRVAATTRGVDLDEAARLRRDVAEAMQFQAEVEAMATLQGMSASSVNVNSQQMTELKADDPMMRAYLQMKRRVAAINAVINSISAAEAKKLLIIAAHRLGEVAGAEFAVGNGEPPSWMQRQKFGTIEMMKALTKNANAAGVTLYPIYPPGLGNTMSDASLSAPVHPAFDHLVLQNEVLSLDTIAKETGGMTAWGPDIVKLLPRIQEDISDYYSLAYRVSGGRADRARDIVVKAKNPEYVVRSRKQFVEKTDETRMKDRVVAALFRRAEDATISIAAQVGAPKKSGRRETFPLSVKVPIGALTLLPQGDGKYAGAFTVYLVTGARLEEVSPVTVKTQPFEIPEKDLARAKASHFTYSLDVVVNTRAERVAVGVLDEVGKTFGLARIELQ